jgi:hypothetical protein
MKHKKSRKNNKANTKKTKANTKTNKNNNNNKKNKKIIIIKNKTPLLIQKISEKVSDTDYNDFFIPHLFNKKNNKTSYSPTINKEIVTLKTMPRQQILDCNNTLAFELKEPLKIGIPGTLYGKNCFDYNTPEAKKYLLKNLAANKHVIISKIVPPIQLQANCWFNAMFTTFFISDKGRKFFHYFRELMIKGKQKNGQIIPEKLRNAFALLNFGIEACLTGNKYAYELNTNSIIHQIYESIPKEYHSKYSYIVDIKKASNPLMYYTSIINYLNNNSILILLVKNCNSNWKEQVAQMVSQSKLPHIIVFEVFDGSKSAGDSGTFLNKPLSFDLKDGKYSLDSAVIRDTTGQHFCSTITCEHEEMGYDGMSFHRIVPLKWKDKINSNFTWKFEGSEDYDKTPLKWSFTHGYQLLMYYRV